MYFETKELKDLVIAKLEAWGNGEPPINCHVGICGNLSVLHYSLNGLYIVDYHAEDWEHYTGERGYPIPSTPNARGAGFTLPANMAYYNMPLWGDSEYGSLRRDLCRHIAKWLRVESDFYYNGENPDEI